MLIRKNSVNTKILYTLCALSLIRRISLSTAMHPDTKHPTIFICDGFEGGIGISETLYANIDKLWEKTSQLINNCECKEGCPSCIYSPKYGNENDPLDNEAAKVILERLLSGFNKMP